MRLAEAGGADAQVFNAACVDSFHHHVDNIITLAEMMVKRKRHAVFYFAFVKRFVNRCHKLCSCRVDNRSDLGCAFDVLVVIIFQITHIRLFAG
ncbi:hypothetical protein SDC9_138340 [bioreactor metagenome]|uniref:Uncharacterized protein n=1 Tax=bioreactor metagenome TaxID=1076179 RepID=A0A645DR80_9ZZZZ